MMKITSYSCAVLLVAAGLAAAPFVSVQAAAADTAAVHENQSVSRTAAAHGRTALRQYDPAADASPSEGIAVAETDFAFAEPLLVRPDTKAIVIHHVGVPAGDTPAAAIHKAHLANGWAGIGYHYVVRQDGTIERGRPLPVVGAHAQGHNYDTIGINVAGNFDRERPTPAQITALEDLIAALCRIYGIEPGVTTIEGHRDVNATACPGRNLYALLPQIRRDVKVQLAEKKLEDVDIRQLLKKEK